MENQTHKKDSYAALFQVCVTKDMQVEIKNCVALNKTLHDFVNGVADCIREKFTDEVKQKMVEILLKENKWAMQGESSTVILNQAVKDAKRKCRKRTTKKKLPTIPPPVGYRSPYLPPKTREEYIRDQLKAQRKKEREQQIKPKRKKSK